MAEHELSSEAAWLSANYASLEAYDRSWIAVRGEEVIASHPDPGRLTELVREVAPTIREDEVLYASVILDRLG